MAHKQRGHRFGNDWSLETMRVDMEHMRTALIVPVNSEIKADHIVLNYDNVRKYVTEAKTISIMDCGCRTKRKHCDAPVGVCIGLNGWAEKFLESEEFRDRRPFRASVDEALETLRRTNEAGLVHMAYIYTDNKNSGKPDVICSCCSCCCEILGATLRYGLAPHLLKASAKSTRDDSKCRNCGTCALRCHFGAREMVNGSLVFNQDKCFGCGLCVSTCPSNVISMRQLS